LGAFEALGNQVYIFLRGLDAGLRFLLEGMKNIYHFLKAHGIHRTVCISSMILNNLENPRPFSFSWLGLWVLGTKLRQAQGIAHFVLHFSGKGQVVFFSRCHPMQGLFTRKAGRNVSYKYLYQDWYK
jgi:hypothetical protein